MWRLPVTEVVNAAGGGWVWVRRKMPESIRVSSGALTGPPPGVVSRNSVMSIRVICPMVAELAVKIGRSRGAEGDAGLKRLVILSAMKRWLPHPGSGHATVDGTAGGV